MCFLLHRVGHLWVGGDRRYRMRHNPPLPWRLSIDIGADIDIGTNYMPKQTISGIKVDKYTAGRIGSDSLNFPISYININSEYLSLTCRDASIHSISFELLHIVTSGTSEKYCPEISRNRSQSTVTLHD